MQEWDYIIVGAGTAGCVLARRLAENSDCRVLMIEAGGKYSRLRFGVPLAGMRATFGGSWKFFTEPQKHLAERRICLPMGKMTGGSSSVNSMMYFRGSARVFDRWSQAGHQGWSYREVLPYFLRAENQERGASEFHGVGGPVDVSDPRHRAAFSEAFVEACLEIGIPWCEDFNGARAEGAGYYQVTQRRGERVSTARSYLDPVKRRAGLQVVTGALVTRVMIDGIRATGVEYLANGAPVRAHAAREVLLSAGAINSPHVLMLSGIGPPDHLREHGIPTLAPLAEVGANLQDHVRIPVLYETPRRSPGRKANWLPAGVDYALRRRGVLASNCCEAGALVRSSPEVETPDLQFVTHFQSSLHARAVDLQFCLLGTRSRGAVTLRSADPDTPPRIDPNYLSEDSEIEALVRGVEWARRIAQTRVLRGFPLGAEILPGANVISDRELTQFFRSYAETCYHPAGTCAMGPVVDSQLRVLGVEGLRVVDASIMPELVEGNTLAATVMIAEKAAAMIVGR